MEPNPIVIPIPYGSRGAINCQANALYYQQIDCSGLNFYGVPALFQGAGEGVAMTTPSGQSVVYFRSVPGQSQLSAQFNFSPNGPSGPFQLATVSTPQQIPDPNYTRFSVSSEDGGYPDGNDSIMFVVYGSDQATDQELLDKLNELSSKA